MIETELFVAAWIVGISALFLLRSSYRFMTPNHRKGDALGLLMQIQEIKQAGHRRPNSPDVTVASGHYAYPYFGQWILSFLPTRLLQFTERFFSGIMDILFSSLFLVLVHIDVLTFSEALIALGLLIATPQFMKPDLAHGIGLSFRKPGLFLTVGSLLSLSYWTQTGSIAALTLSALLGGAVLMTSKFSLQAYTFILLPTGLLVTEIAFGILVSSFILATVVSGGRYIRILKNQLQHLYDYATVKQYKRFDHSFPNPIIILRRFITESSTRERLRMVKNSKRFRPLIDNPIVIAVVAAVILFGGDTLSLPTGYGVWIGAAILAFVLTSLPHLLFLGQPSRYLEYGFLPAAVLVATGWTELGLFYRGIIILLLIQGIAVEFVYIGGYQTFFAPEDRLDATNELLTELHSREPGVVLAQPAYKSRTVGWETPHKIIEYLGGTATSTKQSQQEMNTLYPERSYFVTADVEWLDKSFDPDWVVFDLTKIDELGIKDSELQPPTHPPEFENEEFQLYRFDDVQEYNN